MSETSRNNEHAWLFGALTLLLTGGLGLKLLPIRWAAVSPWLGLLQKELLLGWSVLRMIGSSLRLVATSDPWLAACGLCLLVGIVLLVWRSLRWLARPRTTPGETAAVKSEKSATTFDHLLKYGWPVLALLAALILAIVQGDVPGFFHREAERAVGMLVLGVPIGVVIVAVIFWLSRDPSTGVSQREWTSVDQRINRLLKLHGIDPNSEGSPSSRGSLSQKLDLLIDRLQESSASK